MEAASQAYQSTLSAGDIGVIVALIVVIVGMLWLYSRQLDFQKQQQSDATKQNETDAKLRQDMTTALTQIGSAMTTLGTGFSTTVATLDSMQKSITASFASQPDAIATAIKPLISKSTDTIISDLDTKAALVNKAQVGIAESIAGLGTTLSTTQENIKKMSDSQLDIFNKLKDIPTREIIDGEFVKVIQQLSSMEAKLPEAVALAVAESITSVKKTVLDIYEHVTKPLPTLPTETAKPDPLTAPDATVATNNSEAQS